MKRPFKGTKGAGTPKPATASSMVDKAVSYAPRKGASMKKPRKGKKV